MTLTRRHLLAAVTAVPIAKLFAQQTAQPPSGATGNGESRAVFSSDVKVVNVFATVRDKKGQIVRGLAKDDFMLEEEGRAQVIRYFSAESNVPLTLGLLVDTSVSQRRVLNDERDASYRFFDQVLREDRDQAFVIHFDYDVELLQDLTPSREKLEKALDQLQVGDRQSSGNQGGSSSGGNYPGNGPGNGNGGGIGYPGGGYPRRGGGGPYGGRRGGGGGTNLYDAILLASEDVTRQQKGRKALVLLTDGVDTGSKTTLFRSIQSAQKADTIVYGVWFGESNTTAGSPFGGFGGPGMGRRGGRGGGMGSPRPPLPDNRPDGKKVLQQISRETGGRYFEVSHKLPIDKVYAEIQEDLRNQYSIGYTPDQPADPTNTGAYRHIHVTSPKKDVTVQAREGYYPS